MSLYFITIKRVALGDYIKIDNVVQFYLTFLNYSQDLVNNFLVLVAERFVNLPEKLFIATKYSLLNRGKRVRSALVYAVANLLDIELTKLNAVAASIELIHCYSLIHDDLPAMDDDNFRRGKPSCHKAFDEATAILVGDALQSLAFQVLCDQKLNPFRDSTKNSMVLKLAASIGFAGMVRGQARDMDSENKKISLSDLEVIHADKTGALINCCLELVILAYQEHIRMDRNHQVIIKDDDIKFLQQQLLIYSKHLGLIFQIKDDILDIEQHTAILGKPSKSDQKSQKATFVSILGLAGAKQQLNQHYDLAILALKNLSNYHNLKFDDQKMQLLYSFLDYFKDRDY